jgi:hypothetical protein
MSTASVQLASNQGTQPDPQSAIEKVDPSPADDEEEKDPDDEDLLHGVKLFLAFGAMLFSIFLVALDGVSQWSCVPR